MNGNAISSDEWKSHKQTGCLKSKKQFSIMVRLFWSWSQKNTHFFPGPGQRNYSIWHVWPVSDGSNRCPQQQSTALRPTDYTEPRQPFSHPPQRQVTVKLWSPHLRPWLSRIHTASIFIRKKLKRQIRHIVCEGFIQNGRRYVCRRYS